MKRICTWWVLVLIPFSVWAQRDVMEGRVVSSGVPVSFATVDMGKSTVVADSFGRFRLNGPGNGTYTLRVSATGFRTRTLVFEAGAGEPEILVELEPAEQTLEDVVVTGTMRAVKKSESPVAVEIYTPQFFRKNPSPSLFEGLQTVNGVRPQLNCNVCNTGDIHINGLEGPYTMITIDGMPIVSSLASVYGLFGIPTQLIERVEIVKGPASGLYGSEAVGGLINIITRSPEKAPAFTVDLMTTSWQEHQVDMGLRSRPGKKIYNLTGVNYFYYGQPQDKNKDHFTDVTLQHRVSVFDKLSFVRKENRTATLAARYFYEDRWGGEMNWEQQFRGTDSVYGESIYTNRWELIGNYQLPTPEKIFFSFSVTAHRQNSFYGTTAYTGRQDIAFGQLRWNRSFLPHHESLLGAALRYNGYDDNSVATFDANTGRNRPDRYVLPGIFVQDEWSVGERHLLLTGLRWDHHPAHGSIFTPRIAWKWSPGSHQVFRVNAGTGFRVVNLFTEEHAALTGARTVEVAEALDPERSINVNLNYTRNIRWGRHQLNLDVSTWYSWFRNQILPDYESDPDKIIYSNLSGYAVSRGATVNLEWNAGNRLRAMMGVTIQDVARFDKRRDGKNEKKSLLLTEKWSGTWNITYTFPGAAITIDYTGNVYGPMKLPLASGLDPRPGQSPVWSIQNLQWSKRFSAHVEVYTGIKNLFNWTPAIAAPFLIARSNDPFDKMVQYDNEGKVVATPDNPYALSFDPTYVYAPNQGRRLFAGLRFTMQ